MTARERLHLLVDRFTEEECAGILASFRDLAHVTKEGYERMQATVNAEVRAAKGGNDS